MLECSSVVQETRVEFRIKSYRILKVVLDTSMLDPQCCKEQVKYTWDNQGKAAPESSRY